MCSRQYAVASQVRPASGSPGRRAEERCRLTIGQRRLVVGEGLLQGGVVRVRVDGRRRIGGVGRRDRHVAVAGIRSRVAAEQLVERGIQRVLVGDLVAERQLVLTLSTD